MMTQDVLTNHLSDAMIRCLTVWALVVSAIVVFALAFALTRGASLRCFLTTVRWVQRFVLCAVAIAMGYAVAYIVDWSYTPPGPFVILIGLLMVSTLISAVRHLSPPLTHDMTWRKALSEMRVRFVHWLDGLNHPRAHIRR